MPKLAKPNRIVELSRYHRPWLENALQCSWVSRESKNGPCRLGRNNILHASNCWDECHVNNNINTIFFKLFFVLYLKVNSIGHLLINFLKKILITIYEKYKKLSHN